MNETERNVFFAGEKFLNDLLSAFYKFDNEGCCSVTGESSGIHSGWTFQLAKTDTGKHTDTHTDTLTHTHQWLYKSVASVCPRQ